MRCPTSPAKFPLTVFSLYIIRSCMQEIFQPGMAVDRPIHNSILLIQEQLVSKQTRVEVLPPPVRTNTK